MRWWVLLLMGCAFEPEGALPLDPPAAYRAVWDSAEACTGRLGTFEQVAFYEVPGEAFDGRVGRWTPGRIYIAAEYLDHPMVVKHEMIHELLRDRRHPVHPFEAPCKATWASWTYTTERLPLD